MKLLGDTESFPLCSMYCFKYDMQFSCFIVLEVMAVRCVWPFNDSSLISGNN